MNKIIGVVLFLFVGLTHAADSLNIDYKLKYENMLSYNRLKVEDTYKFWKPLKIGEKEYLNSPFQPSLSSQLGKYSARAQKEYRKSGIGLLLFAGFYIGSIYCMYDSWNYDPYFEEEQQESRQNIMWVCLSASIVSEFYSFKKGLNAFRYYNEDLRRKFEIDE